MFILNSFMFVFKFIMFVHLKPKKKKLGPFTRKDNNKGRYHTYLDYVEKIGKQCGYQVEHE